MLKLWLIVIFVLSCSTQYTGTNTKQVEQVEQAGDAYDQKWTQEYLYEADKINSLPHVLDYMRKHVFSYENDQCDTLPRACRNEKYLPFFKITSAQKSTLQSRSDLPHHDQFKIWDDAAQDREGNYPRLWQLRPDKELNPDAMFAKVMALPTDSYGYVVPQVANYSESLYLKTTRKDNIVVDGRILGSAQTDPWVYRKRQITREPREDLNRWHISSLHPNFSWQLEDSDNPTVEWVIHGESDKVSSPSSGTSRKAWSSPASFRYVYIYGSDVYGTANGIPFKKLGFMDALDVAINFITHIEQAYGVKK